MKNKPSEVPVQKGEKINPSEKTMKTMTQDEKLAEKHSQNQMLKSNQTLTTHIPKK